MTNYGYPYYQYQLAPGNSGLVAFPQQPYMTAQTGVNAAQSLQVVAPTGYTIVPPPPPPGMASVTSQQGVNATQLGSNPPQETYAPGSTISAPAALYSQTSTNISTSVQSSTAQSTASTTEVSSVPSQSTSYQIQPTISESTLASASAGTTTDHVKTTTAATLTQQASVSATASAMYNGTYMQQSYDHVQEQQQQQQHQAVSRSPLPVYAGQKAVPGIVPQVQYQYVNPYSQPTIVMDAAGRQYMVQHALPKVATPAVYAPMMAGGGQFAGLQPYAYAANPSTKLHTTTTVELPASQVPNLCLPNGYPATALQNPGQNNISMPGAIQYNPVAASAVNPHAFASAPLVQRQQQLIQANGHRYVTYVPQQMVARKY